jgi:hypothetical protein
MWGVLLPKLWFSIPIILVQAQLLGHAPTYSVCSHDGQYICFNAIYHLQEQWLEV